MGLIDILALEAEAEAARIAEAEDARIAETNILKKLERGEVIEYNGLKFDTPKLKEAQKDGKIPFEFIFEGDQVGLSLPNPKSDEKFLILMPRDRLEHLINVAIAKDNGVKIKDNRRDQNPHNWQYQSNCPQFLVQTPDKRRQMTQEEMADAYKKAVDALFKMSDLKIIDKDKIIDQYASKAKGNKIANAIFSSIRNTPEWLLKIKIKKRADKYVSDLIKNESKRKENFEQEKQEKIKEYDVWMAKIQKKQEEAAKKKEQQRLASLVHIKGDNFKPTIEVDSLNRSLYFEEKNNFIYILQLKESGKISGQISSSEGSRAIQPEEWRDISKVLQEKLTPEQKNQLGSEFLKGVSQKATTNTQLLHQMKKRDY